MTLAVAAAIVATVAVTGASETPHHRDCTAALASPAPCINTDESSLSTAPKKLNALPRSDDPRWLAPGYNPKWPHLGYNPKWQSFGYEPQYNGFQPPATLRRIPSTQSRSPLGGSRYKESHDQ